VVTPSIALVYDPIFNMLLSGKGVVVTVLHYFFLGFLAVLAACLKALAVGAPLEPGLRIVSPDPLAIRLRLACMFE
jgi:hypothetical protein